MARPRTYALTAAIVAAHAGGPVVLLDARAMGRTFSLYAQRPGPELNVPVRRADIISSNIFAPEVDVEEEEPPLTRVEIRGPLEQRAGFAGECGGWSDGHDAVADRLCAALETGDVLLVIDSPGGANAGLAEAVRRVSLAKEKHGRRITAYADEMIGSAAYYWAACICDEIYVPASGMVGSIGARAVHMSEAGALAQDGFSPTFFAWPDEGKVAFAPELPISDLGKERGNRDVTIAGEAFCAAVVAARPALTEESVRALRADCLTGQAAVDAGLADGVASIDDVEEYALTLAGAAEAGGTVPDASTEESDGKTETRMKRTTIGAITAAGSSGIRSEEDPDKDPDAPEEEGKQPSSVCASCKMQNRPESKFCDQCGASMAARAEDPEEEPAPDSDRAGAAKPGASTAGPGPKSPDEARAAAPLPKPRAYASIAEAAGCRAGASELAVKAAVVRMRQSIDRAQALTGARTLADLDGVILAWRDDVARNATLESSMRQIRATADAKEKLDWLRKVAAADLPGFPRGDLLVDHVDERTGARSTHPAPLYAEMPVATVRAWARAKLGARADSPVGGGASPARRNPFEPDATKLREAGAGVTEEDRALAQKHGHDPAKVAATRNALFNPNGATGARGV